MRYKLAAIIAVLLLAAAAAACGGGDSTSTSTSTSTQPPPEIASHGGLPVAFAMQAGQKALDRSTSQTGSSSSTGGTSASQPGAETSSSSVAGMAYSVSNDGLTVTGYGMASAKADSAILELYFSTSSSYPKPETGSGSSSSSTTPTTASPISEESLKPVIDALVAQGVARGDIEYIGGSYYDPYYASATLRVTVKDLGKLGDLMKAASDAAAGIADVYLQGSYVSYTISDCAALESAAMKEAVKDADARSTALASAVGVTRGAIKGASSDAYSPFGGTACAGGYVGPYAVGGVAYAAGQPQDVQVYATVSVTYAIQ